MSTWRESAEDGRPVSSWDEILSGDTGRTADRSDEAGQPAQAPSAPAGHAVPEPTAPEDDTYRPAPHRQGAEAPGVAGPGSDGAAPIFQPRPWQSPAAGPAAAEDGADGMGASGVPAPRDPELRDPAPRPPWEPVDPPVATTGGNHAAPASGAEARHQPPPPAPPQYPVPPAAAQYPPAQYPAPSQYPPPQYPADQYAPPQYPPPQYAGPQYPAPSQYPPPQYPPAQYPPAQYPAAQYPAAQYPPAQYPAAQYPAPPPFPTDYQHPTAPDTSPAPGHPAQPEYPEPPHATPPPDWSSAAPGTDVADPVRQFPVSEHDLSAQALLRRRRPAPRQGWRRVVYQATGHMVNPGQSPAEQRQRDLVQRATVPVHGCYRIAVISLKGGVGKTTTCVALGATMASLRGDRVIAVDANPDRGTLSGKIRSETAATVRNLLNDAATIQRYSDVRRYTSQSTDRLEVLASEVDPAVSIAFSERDYRTVATILERFYNVVITDCGTGLLHSAMSGVLAMAHQIVVVSSGSVDGARSASATIDWLQAHGYGELIRNGVAVINSVRPKSGGVDIDRVEEHFAARCRAVTRIPYDPHLEEGAEVDLAELRSETRHSLLELAAAVAEGFPATGGLGA